MDLKLFLGTLITIFLAELGDKTQFAALAAASRTNTWAGTLSVWAGVVLGLVLAGTAGVVAGKLLGNVLNPQVLKWLSGGLFIAVGIWVWVAE